MAKKETYINTELKELIKINDDVLIFPIKPTRKKPCALKRYVFDTNSKSAFKIVLYQLTTKAIPICKIIFALFKTQRIKRFLYSLYFLPRTLLLVDTIEVSSIKHIHAYWGGAAATSAMIASELARVSFSFCLHRADIELNDALCLKADKASFVRTISDWGRNKIISLGVKPKKIATIRLGVNIPPSYKVKKRNKLFNIVTVTSFDYVKQNHFLNKKIINEPNAKLTIIGSGQEQRKVARLAAKAKGKIVLLGQLSQKQIFSLYKSRKYDLFVLTSKIEGIPVSAMEAMAYSIPVTLPKVGGCSELVNGSNGYFINENLDNLRQIISDIPSPTKVKNAYNYVKKNYNTRKNAISFLEKIYKHAR